MKIRNKVIGLVLGLFVALFAAQYVGQQLILMPSFASLERQRARTDMTRVVHALQRELDDLGESARGFGNWADSYQYMKDRNAAFATNNLHAGTAIAVGLDLLLLLDRDGHHVWSVGLKPGSVVSGDTAEPMDIDLLDREVLPAGHPWLSAIQRGVAAQGLIKTNKGVLLAAMTPVLDGHGRGPARGAVIFARFLTPAVVAKLSAQAETRLELPPSLPLGANIADGQDPLVELDEVTDVYHTFEDIGGKPAVTLRSVSPRAITAQGRSTAIFSTMIFLTAGVLVLVLLVWALNRTVLSPLSSITQYAIAVGKDGADTSPLQCNRTDELGALAAEINQMLQRLGHAHRELVDLSYESGVAEMASGTLHNIGNAITPLAVHTAGLLRRLRAAPTVDVELALRELANPSIGAERRADVVEFLSLTGAELVRILKEAESELATVERQAESVQEALAAQRAFSMNRTVTEDVTLEQLVIRSIEIVPVEMRKALQIEIDSSIRTIGSVRTSRTVLQQVFQNLIVNAAEAVLGAGRTRGHLRVFARVSNNRAELQIFFEDDGPGVAKENTARIFGRGFSTKSKSSNCGIGLHWCANVLTSIGGRINLAERGSTAGACIEIVLPVDRRAATATQAA